jgi:rhodanese-related sulfurtransferase
MKTMGPQELKNRLEKGEVLLIDVREMAEHQSESIEGACLIPLGGIDLSRLPSTDKPIVIHCRSGKRSADACEKLLAQNPHLDVYSLEGGILGWQQAGFQVKKGEVCALPLDRQTQIAVGFLVVLGTLLGALVGPIFYVIPAFLGLGLMFAGLTGWCGMAKLLSQMRWNKK